MNILSQMGILAKLTIMIGFVPLVMAIVYVVRPTEHNLALMRPLSLAGLFAAIAGTIMGFISMLRFVWTRDLTVDTYKVMAVGAAESLVPVFVGLGCLTVAWLLIAVGMARPDVRE